MDMEELRNQNLFGSEGANAVFGLLCVIFTHHLFVMISSFPSNGLIFTQSEGMIGFDMDLLHAV